ncbi:MAG: dTMP kinase [Gammaproteobacteria bacterium]|nr:dTMP kinase [Gammaproteobacteria bacterium]
MKGSFISFEGIEGSGKSTQLSFAVEYLQAKNIEVVQTREPGGTLVGEKIRDVLLDNQLPSMYVDTELMLMFAARVEHVRKVIQPALQAGKWVVCDRFYDATYAYQGYGRDIDLTRIDALKEFSIGRLSPDLTLLLDVSLEVSMDRVTKRGNKDRFENEKVDFYKKVRNGYLQIAENNSSRVSIVDANNSIDEVQKAIRIHLDGLLNE